jgi:hypothetical protein
LSYLTRKKGTPSQIGIRFPVKKKLTLPPKIAIVNKKARLLALRKVRDIHYDGKSISLIFDGQRLRGDIIIVPSERYVATWDRVNGNIYIDDNIPKQYWKSLGVHEAVERYLKKRYGLSEFGDGHQVAEKVEKKTFLTEHTPSEWAKYSNIVDGVHKKEMYMAGGKLMPKK